MIQPTSRREIRERIHTRIRKHMRGVAERPRLNVFRSQKHIYAQIVQDLEGRTLAAASSAEKSFPLPKGSTVAAAKQVGQLVAQRAKEKGLNRVAFDRGGYQYHGRVKALAEAAREAGLQF